MTTLENISHAHSAELARLNTQIARQLEGSNTMMDNIVMSLLRTKGKQIRPLMVFLCAGLFGCDNDKVLASAAAVELLHNASLIHDDVVDNSPTRRGRPTVNAVWDNHVAVLVGDFFTSSAMQQAIATNDLRIVEVLCNLGRSLSLGEIDQIYNAREHSCTEENYYRIIDYKTASLFVASARMGCLAAGVDDERAEALAEYALLLGRCFQIRDDIFDYFPDETVGKPTGNDLREGKVTLPLIHVIETGVDGSADVENMLENDELTDEDIATIQQFALDNGGIAYAREAMNRLRDRAMECLDIFPPSSILSELRELFDFIIDRKY